MSFGEMILFVLISGLAMSYAWGMRGTTIGGEKGAMLPGAIMGLLIAVFSGSELLLQNFFMLAGVGSMSMYFGGCMTYGETLALSVSSKPAENMKKGLIALFVKGGIWFAIFGAFVGIYLTASTGDVYSIRDFLILFALIPPFALGGYFLLNKPLNVEKNKFPKIYFSITRQESWGGLLGIVVLLVIFMFYRNDYFALKLTLGSAISGAVGWVIAQIGHIITKHPMKNGKYLLSWLEKKKLVDAWKVMECVLGAIGGIGIALTICLLQNDMESIAFTHAQNGALWNPLQAHGKWIALVWIVFIALDMLQFVFNEPASKSELDKLRRKDLIFRHQYDLAKRELKKYKPSKAFKRYRLLIEPFEFPLYSVVPLLFALLGVHEVASLAAFFIVYLVMVQEIGFLHFRFSQSRHIFRVLTLGFGLAIILAQFISGWTPGIKLTMLMYVLFYEFVTLLWAFPSTSIRKLRRKTKKEMSFTDFFGARVSVHAYFVICVIILAVFTFIYF